jgi:tetratricopeptide (TPR) repeat protein
MTTLGTRILAAKARKSEGEAGMEAARLLLAALAHEFPDQAEAQVEAAYIHDALGREAEAIFYYEQALRIGLTGIEDPPAVHLGLGSSYRTLGRYDEARAVLEQACRLFPDDRALRVFLAMVHYNVGESSAAMATLLTIIAETAEDARIRAYAGAIAFYADRLDQTWT